MKETILNDLLLMGEDEYRDFHSKLVPTIEKSRIIGIRVPKLRKYARHLENYDDFLNALPHSYLEENNLHAFLIEREKDFDKCIKLLNEFLPFIDNWATCDCLKPNALKKEPEKLLEYIKTWLNSGYTYTVRFAVNLLMSLYLDENFKEEYLKLVVDIKSDEYYVYMVRAWYFATALAKQYKYTLPYFEKSLLDVKTHNKAIQKALESFRITDEQKKYLKILKRK